LICGRSNYPPYSNAYGTKNGFVASYNQNIVSHFIVHWDLNDVPDDWDIMTCAFGNLNVFATKYIVKDSGSANVFMKFEHPTGVLLA